MIVKHYCGSRLFIYAKEGKWIIETDPQWIDGCKFCRVARFGRCMARVWNDYVWRVNGLPSSPDELDIDYYGTESSMKAAKEAAKKKAGEINNSL